MPLTNGEINIKIYTNKRRTINSFTKYLVIKSNL